MNKNIILIITAICVLFFAAVATNITPFLRGPVEWRWPYQFINTLNKLWFPIISATLILCLFRLIEIKKIKNIKTIFLFLFLLSFFWQVSVLYFSRAGVGVLAHRIYEPGLNGYYSAGISIKNPIDFVINFPKLVLDLPMHAKGHPPGIPLVFYFLNQLMTPAGMGLSFAILNSLAIIPLYFLTKSWRAVFFFITIPSLVLFLPLPDVFFPFFGILSFCFLKYKKDFLAGLVMAVGLFFSYSILPVLLFLIFLKPKKTFYIPIIIYFLLFWQTFLVVIGGQAPRDYLTWVFFNLWDFIVFAGWPLIILVMLNLIQYLYNHNRFRVKPGMTINLIFTIILLNFSGASRAETGRIWLPLMVLLVIPAASYLKEKKFPTNFVMILFALQMIQTLVIQEFWVPLW